MADEWWSSTRFADDDGRSPCSTAPATDQPDDDAAESAVTSATSIDFRPALRVVDDAAAPPSFLRHMDWTQAYMGGTTPPPPAATTSFNALLQLHGDAGHHFLLRQKRHADGAAPVAPEAESLAASGRSASSMYAGNQLYSSYGGDVSAAALMTKPPFPQQEFSSLLGATTRNSGDVPAAPPMTTKPLLLQALEQKAFKSNKEPTQDACSSATRSVSSSPSPAKKLRVATPSPLPTFKVRKEKLGDRITALQQLVSPFGKTDTASVLHEAIEYIRFLHDQVASLSSPYLRCGRRPVQHQLQQQQAKDDGGKAKEDLRSRGLCLVPVASTTYAVAASETAPPEFWPPTFGGTLQ